MNIRNIDEELLRLRELKSEIDFVLKENGADLTEDAPEPLFKTDCEELKNLKVAAIMDGFTLGNFKNECRLFEITSGDWKNEIDEFSPDMLFIESAWNGKNNSWYKKIAGGSRELYDLTEYCRDKNIPVVFWNKEDPIYTDVFMSAASSADFVFTTDYDCIERYKRTLQHNNVFFLHFSAEPSIHNPIEKYDRKDKFCFAGAYYHRYKERSRVFDSFSEVFKRTKGFEIYDRNLGSARPEHAFPARYSKMIVGTLKPSDIDIAYKGYDYGVNMNSVNQSQSMFARRVFELLASNTVCVGNYSKGLKNILGDLTICTDDALYMEKLLDRFCKDEESLRKYRLSGLRKVLKEHLTEDRLGYIAFCVFGKDMKKKLPHIYVLSDACEEEDREYIKKSFYKQTYNEKTLVFIKDWTPEFKKDSFLAAFSKDDHYGENYLTDLALSVRYSSFDGYGKARYYENENGVKISNRDGTYKETDKLYSARSIIKSELIEDIDSFAKGREITGKFFCTDEFNYCKNYNKEGRPACDDMDIPDRGIELNKINEAAQSIKYENLDSDILRITPAEILEICPKIHKKTAVKLEGGKFIITSRLADNKTALIPLNKKFSVDDFFRRDIFSCAFECGGDLDLESVCTFYDGAMKELGSNSQTAGIVLKADVPKNAKYVKLSIRIKGSGEKEFSSILLGSALLGGSLAPALLSSDVITVTDRYPSYDDLYEYMFVHRRNVMYRENGLMTEEFSISAGGKKSFREFEGVPVTEGDADVLSSVLSSGKVKTVLVHFLNPYLWGIIKNYLSDIRLIIWSHGSDIQPWRRREFLYNTEEEIKNAKAQSKIKEDLWKEVFEYSNRYDIRFVYVSEWLKNQVEEDYNVDLTGKACVIHNCIDTDLFKYSEKDESQRFNIMTVKSFSSKIYANDITRDAILILSREPEFPFMTFDIYGDGSLFAESTKALGNFKNVRLHRGFLTQSEIAEIHKSHGIYIATTRMDTQGASRDEAMSSGLVPVATDIAAVPEFLDETSGILTPPEDPKAVADAILKLIRDPKLFKELSENASKKVSGLSSKQKTIKKEIDLIKQ